MTIQFPEWETHLQKMCAEYPEVNGKQTYQYRKLETALQYAGDGMAIDIGAHIGLWSMHLLDTFEKVLAFEPVEEYRGFYVQNVTGNYVLYPYALGDENGRGAPRVMFEGCSGSTETVEGDVYDIKRLDDFGFNNIAFIKIDCEGYEARVIRGGIETIKRNRPAIIVEQKYNQDALPLLLKIGMVEKAVDCGDHIFAWD